MFEKLEKKDPGKCTVRFNIADPQQKLVIDLLNRQGRYKAPFLTSAILHYVHCSETPDIMGVPAMGSEEIERIVRNILAEQQTSGPAQAPKMPGTSFEESTVPASEKAEGGQLVNEDREAIRKTLYAFHQKQETRHDSDAHPVMPHSVPTFNAVIKLSITFSMQRYWPGESWDSFCSNAEKSFGAISPNSK